MLKAVGPNNGQAVIACTEIYGVISNLHCLVCATNSVALFSSLLPAITVPVLATITGAHDCGIPRFNATSTLQLWPGKYCGVIEKLPVGVDPTGSGVTLTEPDHIVHGGTGIFRSRSKAISNAHSGGSFVPAFVL